MFNISLEYVYLPYATHKHQRSVLGLVYLDFIS